MSTLGMIKQAHISEGLRFFREPFMQKYRLRPYYNQHEPLAIFSPCRNEDYMIYLRHKGPVMVVWCGSDGMYISEAMAKLLKSREAVHVASSAFLSADLTRWGIPHKIVPNTPVIPVYDPHPLGDCIYHYGTPKSDFYKNSWIPEIQERTGIEVISTHKNSYSKAELKEIYKRCFVALRLTDHDGLPTTCVEMGLMGRPSIHNGDIPHGYKYKTIDDVVRIIKEIEIDPDKVARDWMEFLSCDDWLNL